MDDNLPEPSALLADRGHDTDHTRNNMDKRDILIQIPMRKTCNMRLGVDHMLYRLRNTVERCLNKLKKVRPWQPASTRLLNASWASSTSHHSAFGYAICQQGLVANTPNQNFVAVATPWRLNRNMVKV